MGFQSAINQSMAAIKGSHLLTGTKTSANTNVQRMDKANKKVKQKQQAKKKQRRSFNDYISRMGFNEYTKDIQKTIKASYNSKQRKEIMDKMDLADKKGARL